MKQALLTLCIISALLTSSLGFSADEKDNTAAAPKAALTVTVVKPTMQEWSTGIAATGSLAAWQEAVIASEISGLRITELKVDVGDKVKRGQVLAVLSQEAVVADVAKAQAAVAQAEASLADAKINANRARSLKSTGALPDQQIDQYITSEATAKAALDAQRAALKAEQIRLTQTKVLAVDDGVVSSRSATLGSVVQTGTELFRLVRKNRIEWQAEVPGRDSAQIQAEQKAQLRLPTGESVEGSVRMIAPTLDANTRNIVAYVSLPLDSPAKAGMFAQGTILTGASQALTVPQTAVVLRDGNSYVFEVSNDNHVAQRLVKTGRRLQDSVEILEGLSDQAQVVNTGGAFLNDGDTVQIVAPAANPTKPNPAP